MTGGRPRPVVVSKVVAYLVHEDRLLVFTHDDFSLLGLGVQVPAGTIEPGEAPEHAAVREVAEETGLRARVVRPLGVERYDLRPAKPEIHERHFFHLAPEDQTFPERWSAGEPHPSGGGAGPTWTCFWIPVRQAHVLCAGFGARLGAITEHAGGGRR